jgi:hypothetical protein
MAKLGYAGYRFQPDIIRSRDLGISSVCVRLARRHTLRMAAMGKWLQAIT